MQAAAERCEPFEAHEIALADLWIEPEASPSR